MKKLFLILLFAGITQLSPAQTKEDYKTYKPCSECFDKWHNTGLDNYGVASPSQSHKERKDTFAKQQCRMFFSGLIAIVASAVTYIAYTKIVESASK